MYMECKNCNSKYVVNKFWRLCNECNNKRLHGSKYGKQVDNITKKPSVLKPHPKSTKPTKKSKPKKSMFNPINPLTDIRVKVNLYEADSEFYRKCFDTFSGYCEECGTKQPESVEDENGRVINRWRYSHIIPKSIAQELRHKIYNINDLCLKCHMEWENGDKEKMNIYEGNCDTFPGRF